MLYYTYSSSLILLIRDNVMYYTAGSWRPTSQYSIGEVECIECLDLAAQDEADGGDERPNNNDTPLSENIHKGSSYWSYKDTIQ